VTVTQVKAFFITTQSVALVDSHFPVVNMLSVLYS